MGWEDRASLDAILRVYDLNESDSKLLMKRELRQKSYTLWRERMKNSNLKHESLKHNKSFLLSAI